MDHYWHMKTRKKDGQPGFVKCLSTIVSTCKMLLLGSTTLLCYHHSTDIYSQSIFLLCVLQHELNISRLKKVAKNERLKEKDDISTPLSNVADTEAPILSCDLLQKTIPMSHVTAARKHGLKPVSEEQMVKSAPARRRIVDWAIKSKEKEDSDSNDYATDDEHQALTDSDGLEDLFMARRERCIYPILLLLLFFACCEVC